MADTGKVTFDIIVKPPTKWVNSGAGMTLGVIGDAVLCMDIERSRLKMLDDAEAYHALTDVADHLFGQIDDPLVIW